MHSEEMSARVARFLGEADELQKKKNPDYHPERVAYLEILRTAFECGITVEQDLWAKIRKQYVALQSFVIHGEVHSEAPRARMLDIAVYMGMLAVWTEHKVKIVDDAFDYLNANVKCEKSDGTFTCLGQQRPLFGNAEEAACQRCQFMEWLRARSSHPQRIRVEIV